MLYCLKKFSLIVQSIMPIFLSLSFFLTLFGVNAKFEFEKDAERFTNNVNLSCTVKREIEEENSADCWSFAYGRETDLPHPNADNRNCCKTATSNDELPDSLKDVVKINADGEV